LIDFDQQEFGDEIGAEDEEERHAKVAGLLDDCGDLLDAMKQRALAFYDCGDA